jgi:predicted nucleic acid-binding protein
MARGGRNSRPRGVYSFEDESLDVPERVVLDTSFVVEALLSGQKQHAACQAYLVRLARKKTAIFYSALLEAELAETAFQVGLKERHPKDWKKYRNDGRSRQRPRNLMMDTLDAWETIVHALPSHRVELSTVNDLVPDLMGRYGIASYDAVHVATAIHEDVRRIVTKDLGFASVPASEVDLYVDSSRLALCRSRRA